MTDSKTAKRANVLLVTGAFAVAAAMVAIVEVGRCSAPATPSEPGAPRPSSSGVQLFDGGYVVGSASEINSLLRAKVAGSRTACEEPAPTAEERARWTRTTTPYSSLTMTELLGQSDSDLAVEVEKRLQDMIYGAGYAAMSREEQNVYLVYVLRVEVEMGGLETFFSNSSGNCAVRTAAALAEVVGQTESSATFRRALAVFPDAAPSEDRSTRFAQIDALGQRRKTTWEQDEEFYGIAMSAEVAAYIRRHATAFVFPR